MLYTFCPKCGTRLATRRIEDRDRPVCPECGFVHYNNALPCVGVLAVDKGDVLLVDTAGRIHTNANLMNELEKVKRVVLRELPGARLESLLVLDATIGQNAIQQAREFLKFSGLTGIFLTKVDGTAKGGAVVAIAEELDLPIRFIGVGEGEDDLFEFSPREFVEALLS